MNESILAPVAALALPDSAALSSRAQQALAFIQGFQITDSETYALAADELKSIKGRANALEEQRTGITGPINKALKAINDLFRGPSELLTQAEGLLKTKMLSFSREQERIAAEARRAAEAQAAELRRRSEEEAEARRVEAERQAALAKKAKDEGDAAAATIAQAAADRAHAESQAAATTAQLITAPLLPVDRPKVAGLSTSTKIDFEVTNLLQLVQHVAAHPELINLVIADSVKLRAYVRGLGTNCALPGVRVFDAQVLSARAA